MIEEVMYKRYVAAPVEKREKVVSDRRVLDRVSGQVSS